MMGKNWLKNYCSSQSIESFWNGTVANAEKFLIEEPKLPRQARKPFRFRVQGVTMEQFKNVINFLEKGSTRKGLNAMMICNNSRSWLQQKRIRYEGKLNGILGFYDNDSF